MANIKVNPDERTTRVNLSLTPTNLSQLDALTNNGNRSAKVRELIEDAFNAQEVEYCACDHCNPVPVPAPNGNTLWRCTNCNGLIDGHDQ